MDSIETFHGSTSFTDFDAGVCALIDPVRVWTAVAAATGVVGAGLDSLLDGSRIKTLFLLAIGVLEARVVDAVFVSVLVVTPPDCAKKASSS